jgi:hypothetical protein
MSQLIPEKSPGKWQHEMTNVFVIEYKSETSARLDQMFINLETNAYMSQRVMNREMSDRLQKVSEKIFPKISTCY